MPTNTPPTADPIDPVLVAKQPLLLTLKEACDSLRIGRAKLYDLMSTGQLRYVKIGSARRIPVRAMTDFIALKERTSAPSLRAAQPKGVAWKHVSFTGWRILTTWTSSR